MYTVRGVFNKKEKDHYHFILPEVYNDINEPSSTYNTINNYHNAIESKQAEKINELNINVSSVSSYKPFYRDPSLKSKSAFTGFRCKSTRDLQFLVGLEYFMKVNFIEYKFLDKDDPTKYVMGWYIQIISIKEDTKL